MIEIFAVLILLIMVLILWAYFLLRNLQQSLTWNSRSFFDQYTELGYRIDMLKTELGKQLIPALESVLDGFNQLMQWFTVDLENWDRND